MQIHDNCDNCQKDYSFNVETDKLFLFVNNPECNYIRAICPSCDNPCNIFVTAQGILAILDEVKIPLILTPDAPEQVLSDHQELLGDQDDQALTDYHPSGTTYDLPEPTRAELMELHDGLREFGGQSKMNGQCTTKGCPDCGSDGPVRVAKKSW